MSEAHALLASALRSASSPFDGPRAPLPRKCTSSGSSSRRSFAPMDVDQIELSPDNNTPRLQHTRYDYDDDASSEASDSSYIFERRPSTPAAITENEEDQRPRKLLESYAQHSIEDCETERQLLIEPIRHVLDTFSTLRQPLAESHERFMSLASTAQKDLVDSSAQQQRLTQAALAKLLLLKKQMDVILEESHRLERDRHAILAGFRADLETSRNQAIETVDRIRAEHAADIAAIAKETDRVKRAAEKTQGDKFDKQGVIEAFAV